MKTRLDSKKSSQWKLKICLRRKDVRKFQVYLNWGRDPFNQNSNRSDREKRTTSKGGPVFPKLFRLDRTDPLSFGPKFPEILVEWIAPWVTCTQMFKISQAFSFVFTVHYGAGGTAPVVTSHAVDFRACLLKMIRHKTKLTFKFLNR